MRVEIRRSRIRGSLHAIGQSSQSAESMAVPWSGI